MPDSSIEVLREVAYMRGFNGIIQDLARDVISCVQDCINEEMTVDQLNTYLYDLLCDIPISNNSDIESLWMLAGRIAKLSGFNLEFIFNRSFFNLVFGNGYLNEAIDSLRLHNRNRITEFSRSADVDFADSKVYTEDCMEYDSLLTTSI